MDDPFKNIYAYFNLSNNDNIDNSINIQSNQSTTIKDDKITTTPSLNSIIDDTTTTSANNNDDDDHDNDQYKDNNNGNISDSFSFPFDTIDEKVDTTTTTAKDDESSSTIILPQKKRLSSDNNYDNNNNSVNNNSNISPTTKKKKSRVNYDLITGSATKPKKISSKTPIKSLYPNRPQQPQPQSDDNDISKDNNDQDESLKSNDTNIDDQPSSSSSSSTSSTNKGYCPICQCKPNNGYISLCGHVCCYECWCQWLSLKLECPICRERTRIKQIKPIPNNIIQNSSLQQSLSSPSIND